MRLTAVRHQQMATRYPTVDLIHKPTEPRPGHLGDKSRIALAGEGTQSQIQVQTLIANLHRCIRTVACRRPLTARFCAGTRPQLILEQNALRGKVSGYDREFFL